MIALTDEMVTTFKGKALHVSWERDLERERNEASRSGRKMRVHFVFAAFASLHTQKKEKEKKGRRLCDIK